MLDYLCAWTFTPALEFQVRSRPSALDKNAKVISIEAATEACCASLLVCRSCGAHLSTTNQIMSKSFTGRLGRACLVSQTSNVSVTTKDERVLSTGTHIVGDIVCLGCATVVGWKYIATPRTQAYKQDKFILEEHRIRKVNAGWLD